MLGHNMIPYTVGYLDCVTQSDIPSLALADREIAKKMIESKLVLDPLGYGKPLRYSLLNHRRLKVTGVCCIIYRIVPEERRIVVVSIHRLRSNEKEEALQNAA